MLQILICNFLKKSCCKLKNLAANKIKLLQIFKTSCCKLKHQKCARALKERGVGSRSFIFLSGKLLLLLCFAVRAVGNALQSQISVINVVSNLI